MLPSHDTNDMSNTQSLPPDPTQPTGPMVTPPLAYRRTGGLNDSPPRCVDAVAPAKIRTPGRKLVTFDVH